MIDIEDAQAHYGIDDHHEAASGRVPVIYISPVDIYSLHCVLADQLHAIVSQFRSTIFERVTES